MPIHHYSILSVCTFINNYFRIQSSKGLGRVSCQLVHINEKTNCLWSMAMVHSKLSDTTLICTVIILFETAFLHERIFCTLCRKLFLFCQEWLVDWQPNNWTNNRLFISVAALIEIDGFVRIIISGSSYALWLMSMCTLEWEYHGQMPRKKRLYSFGSANCSLSTHSIRSCQHKIRVVILYTSIYPVSTASFDINRKIFSRKVWTCDCSKFCDFFLHTCTYKLLFLFKEKMDSYPKLLF